MKYTVNATYTDDGAWHVHVVEIDRVTQARSLAEIEPMARDLVEIMTDAPADDVDLTVHRVLPKGVTLALDRVDEQRAAEMAARAAAARSLRDAAVGLKSRGMSVRELGAVLGVSHQRASQLTSGG